jgi:hypothetical protein
MFGRRLKGGGHGRRRILKRRPCATSNPPNPHASTDGKIDPARPDVLATVVPLNATADALGDALDAGELATATGGAVVAPVAAAVGVVAGGT